MANKTKLYCQTCCKKTEHETRTVNGQETLVCTRCEIPVEQQPDNRPEVVR